MQELRTADGEGVVPLRLQAMNAAGFIEAAAEGRSFNTAKWLAEPAEWLAKGASSPVVAELSSLLNDGTFKAVYRKPLEADSDSNSVETLKHLDIVCSIYAAGKFEKLEVGGRPPWLAVAFNAPVNKGRSVEIMRFVQPGTTSGLMVVLPFRS